MNWKCVNGMQSFTWDCVENVRILALNFLLKICSICEFQIIQEDKHPVSPLVELEILQHLFQSRNGTSMIGILMLNCQRMRADIFAMKHISEPWKHLISTNLQYLVSFYTFQAQSIFQVKTQPISFAKFLLICCTNHR